MSSVKLESIFYFRYRTGIHVYFIHRFHGKTEYRLLNSKSISENCYHFNSEKCRNFLDGCVTAISILQFRLLGDDSCLYL
jgi:hypothetical protein